MSNKAKLVLTRIVLVVLVLIGLGAGLHSAWQHVEKKNAEEELYREIPDLRLSRYPSYNYTGAGREDVVAYHILWKFVDPEGDSTKDYCVKVDLPMFPNLEDLVFDQDAKDRHAENPKEPAWSIIAGDERSLNAQSNRGHSGWYRTDKPLAPSVKVLVIRPKTRDARIVLLRPMTDDQKKQLESILVTTAQKMGMDRLEAGSWEDKGNNEFLFKYTLK